MSKSCQRCCLVTVEEGCEEGALKREVEKMRRKMRTAKRKIRYEIAQEVVAGIMEKAGVHEDDNRNVTIHRVKGLDHIRHEDVDISLPVLLRTSSVSGVEYQASTDVPLFPALNTEFGTQEPVLNVEWANRSPEPTDDRKKTEGTLFKRCAMPLRSGDHQVILGANDLLPQLGAVPQRGRQTRITRGH